MCLVMILYYNRPVYIGRFQRFVGHKSPQGEQSYSSPLFLTSTLVGVEGVSFTHRPHLTPWKNSVPIVQETRPLYYYYYRYSALGPVWAETSQSTGTALVRCILGKFLGQFAIAFHRVQTFPLSPPGASTSATTREILVAEGGTVGENIVR